MPTPLYAFDYLRGPDLVVGLLVIGLILVPISGPPDRGENINVV
jgi:hypothetical protein